MERAWEIFFASSSTASKTVPAREQRRAPAGGAGGLAARQADGEGLGDLLRVLLEGLEEGADLVEEDGPRRQLRLQFCVACEHGVILRARPPFVSPRLPSPNRRGRGVDRDRPAPSPGAAPPPPRTPRAAAPRS